MTKAQAMVDAAAEQALADSQVRDEAGNLLHLYHGSGSDYRFYIFDTFNKRSRGDLGNVGSHFGPKGTAEEFSKDNLYDVYLNMKKIWEAPFDFFADNYNNAYLEVLISLKKECESPEPTKHRGESDGCHAGTSASEKVAAERRKAVGGSKVEPWAESQASSRVPSTHGTAAR